MSVSISGAGSISGLDQGFNVTTGSVGVGTTNPRTDLQVGAFGSGSDSNIQLATGTSGASNILFGDGSGGTDWYKGFIKYNHSTDNLELYTTDDLIHYTGGSERLRIESNGEVRQQSTGGSTIYELKRTDSNTTGAVGTINFTASDGHSVASMSAMGDGDNEGAHLVFRTTSAAANNSPYNAATAERLRIRAEGPHLLVGTGGDATYNEITESSSNAGLVIGSSSMGNGGIVIRNSTSGTGRIYFADNSGSDPGRQRGQINYYHNGDYMMFATAGSEKLRITSGGDVQARRSRSNTAGDVALSIQPTDSTIHYGFRIDSANNNLNLDRVGSGNLTTFRNDGLIFAKALHVTDNLTPTSGRGVEIFEASAGVGQISSYNRDANSWDELRLKGSEVRLYANNNLRLDVQNVQSYLYGTSDGILNLDTTDGRGSFIRFKENGNTKAWVGCAEGMGGGTSSPNQDDLGLRASRYILCSAGGAERLRIQNIATAVHVRGESALTGTTGDAKGLSLAVNGANSCPLYFGTETHSAQKSMYLNGYWMYIRGHSNEGIRFVFSQGSGTAPRSDQYQFKYNQATRPTGNTTWDGFSDRRAKENVQDVTSALDTIGRLRPVTFDWTNDYADRMNMFNMDKTDPKSYNWFSVKENGYDESRKNNNVGFIAQEFEEVFPKDITETEMELGDETITDFKTVNFDSLVPMLTKAVQELKAENDSLRARLDAAGL